jgi:hypothetical protein
MIRPPLVWLGLLLAPLRASGDGAVEVHTRAPLLGGVHYRLPTPRGPVHVWSPPGYLPERAGLTLFAHGYGTSADRVWVQSRLAAQFRASGRNALFIVPEGPRHGGQPLTWPSLAELRAVVARRLCAELPAGEITLVGHSSGLRTVIAWLRDPDVREVVLLDGLYGQRDTLAAWLAERPRRRLRIVAARSRAAAERWLDKVPAARRLAYVPQVVGELTREEREAPLLYLRSQYAHSEMVRRPVVIPLALRIATAPRR